MLLIHSYGMPNSRKSHVTAILSLHGTDDFLPTIWLSVVNIHTSGRAGKLERIQEKVMKHGLTFDCKNPNPILRKLSSKKVKNDLQGLFQNKVCSL